MSEDTNILPFHQPGTVLDPLTEIAREGARRMLMAALKAEADSFVAGFAEDLLPDGRRRVVRHGVGPEREIQTGIGPIPVQRPKVRDRADVPVEAKIRFSSAILPKWARRSKSLDALLPALYLRGLSTGDVQEALAAILGAEAPNLSPGVMSRLTAEWQDDLDRWQRRDLSARRYVYVWADGVYLQARMEPQAECMLVILGATPEGRKELVGFQVGIRESTQSWRELLVDLKARGLGVPPGLAVGDGALGFWKALEEAFPGTRHQRCWFHKTANVLNAFPKSMQPAVTADLREISRAAAAVAIEIFAEKYGAKYPRGVILARKVREKLAAIRQQERDGVYQRYLFAPEAKVEVSFDQAFAFKDGMYWDQRRYRGRWKPRKHFLGPDHVPAFDGAENGEEFQCAQAIDSLPGLKFWIRNVARHPNSFWLPTATDKFYPDFVAQLEDGRLLVVEYKGAHFADGPDTAEKRTIGQLWEKKTGGKGVFVVVEKTVDGRDMRAQMVNTLQGST